MPLVALAGCELLDPVECNLMYAPDQVSVTIESDSWATGTYTIEADGLSCDVVLPDDAGNSVECDAEIFVTVSADGASIESFSLWRAPASLEVALSLDGVEVDRQTLTPAYTESEPNGEGCGFVSFGDATWTIPGA